mgnify:CR=1 FL=1
MARIARSLGALTIALVPTLPGGEIACALSQCVLGFSLASTVHWLGAAAFFGALAVFCLVLFVRGSEGSTEKEASNRIYRVCGWTIVGSMAAIGLLIIANFLGYALIGPNGLMSLGDYKRQKAEKGRESVFDGVPDAIPALLFALKVQKKALSVVCICCRKMSKQRFNY